MTLISLLGKYDSSIFPILFEFKNQISKHIIIHDDSRYETKKVQKILLSQEKKVEKKDADRTNKRKKVERISNKEK